MTILAMSLSKLFGSDTVTKQDIFSIRDKSQVGRITTSFIIAEW